MNKNLGDKIFIFVCCCVFLLAMIMIAVDNYIFNIVFYVIVGIYFIYAIIHIFLIPLINKEKKDKKDNSKNKEDKN